MRSKWTRQSPLESPFLRYDVLPTPLYNTATTSKASKVQCTCFAWHFVFVSVSHCDQVYSSVLWRAWFSIFRFYICRQVLPFSQQWVSGNSCGIHNLSSSANRASQSDGLGFTLQEYRFSMCLQAIFTQPRRQQQGLMSVKFSSVWSNSNLAHYLHKWLVTFPASWHREVGIVHLTGFWLPL